MYLFRMVTTTLRFVPSTKTYSHTPFSLHASFFVVPHTLRRDFALPPILIPTNSGPTAILFESPPSPTNDILHKWGHTKQYAIRTSAEAPHLLPILANPNPLAKSSLSSAKGSHLVSHRASPKPSSSFDTAATPLPCFSSRHHSRLRQAQGRDHRAVRRTADPIRRCLFRCPCKRLQ